MIYRSDHYMQRSTWQWSLLLKKPPKLLISHLIHQSLFWSNNAIYQPLGRTPPLLWYLNSRMLVPTLCCFEGLWRPGFLCWPLASVIIVVTFQVTFICFLLLFGVLKFVSLFLFIILFSFFSIAFTYESLSILRIWVEY